MVKFLSRLRESVGSATRGLKQAFKTEQNFRIQIMIGAVALISAWYFPLRTWEKIVVVLLVGAVLVMELLNTALEYFSDLLKPRLHHYVFIIKDVMAAAVLLTSLIAASVGLIIFLPYFIKW